MCIYIYIYIPLMHNPNPLDVCWWEGNQLLDAAPKTAGEGRSMPGFAASTKQPPFAWRATGRDAGKCQGLVPTYVLFTA